MQLDVDRRDFHTTRLVDDTPPEQLADGHVVLALESFAFTANNITYAVAGDMLDYWGFFPAEAPWGRIPVMGIGRVVRSTTDGVAEGGRYFGFFPMAAHHVVEAAPSRDGFTDRGAHRAGHAATYRSFNLLDRDAAYRSDLEGEYLVARGLFITSYLVDDFLADQGDFGAAAVVVTSASSRTSIALAHRLHARGMRAVGVTSAGNVPFVERLGLYDQVVTYDGIDAIDPNGGTVIVDMAGNADLLVRLHTHLGEGLAHSCRVGATHWDAGGSVAGIPGPAPAFFFAPSQIKKRSDEWGREEFEARVATALSSFLEHASGWMTIERGAGPDAVQRVYLDTLDGRSRPEVGHILTMREA